MNVHALMNHVLVNCQVQNVLTKLMTKKDDGARRDEKRQTKMERSSVL